MKRCVQSGSQRFARFTCKRSASLTATLMVLGMWGSTADARSVFINGVDVSSGKNIQLKNVQVTINEHGDIHISAPQYDVNEEDNFTPLSRYMHGPATTTTPVHKPMQAIGAASDGQSTAPTAPAHDSLPAAGNNDDPTRRGPEQNSGMSPEKNAAKTPDPKGSTGTAAAGG